MVSKIDLYQKNQLYHRVMKPNHANQLDNGEDSYNLGIY